MIVYRLVQHTFGGGKYGDFSLPKTIGYYSTERLAKAGRHTHRNQLAGASKQSAMLDRTLDSDYTIEPVEVHQS